MPHAERAPGPEPRPGFRGPASDTTFLTALSVLGGSYVVLIVALLAADVHFLLKDRTLAAVYGAATRYAAWLTLIPCVMTAALAPRGAGSDRAASSPLAGMFGTRYAVWLGLISCSVTAALALVVAGSDRSDPKSLPTLTMAIRSAVWLSLISWSTTAALTLLVVRAGGATESPVAEEFDPATRFTLWLSLISCSVTAALTLYVAGADLADAVVGLISPQIRYAFWFSLISCSVTALLSLVVAVPLGYLLSRFRFPLKWLVDALLDIPIVLPPLVIGLSLLILFQTRIGRAFEGLWRKGMDGAINYALLPSAALVTALVLFRLVAFLGRIRLSVLTQTSVVLLLTSLVLVGFRLAPQTETVVGVLRDNLAAGITYEVPGVILAQFAVACAFAVRTMRVTFDDIPRRREDVALTLGCGRAQAFWRVVLPEARRGMVTAATLAWARALGEFGPILVFAGATRMKTEVLSTTVFLELSVGNLRAAVAVSLLMVLAALVVLLVVRRYGMGRSSA